MKRFAYIAVLMLSVCSCKAPVVPSDQEVFADRTDVCIMVGYKNMIDFSSGDMQYSFNESKHIYRAGVTLSQDEASTGQVVQTVQQYYVLHANGPIGEVGSSVTGNLVLCSPSISSGQRTYAIKEGTVLKADASQVWVWDPALHLGVIIRIE